ncbi:MAG: hypothetical protein COW18_00750 [Zetaproteobacteria bacterium CG12_big_fil_rev_8_21_14_0_65_54_13]|nr:MAG: hypothetical protein COW18_00750 [Zetaproteobacteria bacterium CG12_big_fil_rev_8_21_14_0_65_54_13]PJA27286.1 MAG: hypothetical protein CO188_12690 [Zetaproteobacteria bacterium CG_4_9_14_3_um_filter_54_145]
MLHGEQKRNPGDKLQGRGGGRRLVTPGRFFAHYRCYKLSATLIRTLAIALPMMPDSVDAPLPIPAMM